MNATRLSGIGMEALEREKGMMLLRTWKAVGKGHLLMITFPSALLVTPDLRGA